MLMDIELINTECVKFHQDKFKTHIRSITKQKLRELSLKFVKLNFLKIVILCHTPKDSGSPI